jgi:hypothetical protein
MEVEEVHILLLTKHIIHLNLLTLVVVVVRLGYKVGVGANHPMQQPGKTIKGRLQTIMINNCNTSITTVTPGKSKTLTL